MFRVIIAGTRHFKDYALLCRYADTLLEQKRRAGEEIVIVSGHCRGADLLGERYAKERGYQYILSIVERMDGRPADKTAIVLRCSTCINLFNAFKIRFRGEVISRPGVQVY